MTVISIIQSPAHKLFSRPPCYMANDSHHTVTVTRSLALSLTATGHALPRLQTILFFH